MKRKFTGDESAADILKLVLEDFPNLTLAKGLEAAIIYEDGLPFLRFHAQVIDNRGEFTSHYRLDEMLLAIFPECERIYNETDEQGLFGESFGEGGKSLIRQLSYYAMSTMLSLLLLRQLTMFVENFEDTLFLTASTLLYARAQVYPDDSRVKREAGNAVRTLLNKTVDASTERNRAILIKLLEGLPTLQISVGKGRPKGSTKPIEKKAREAAEFEKEIEEAIRTLRSTSGNMPTKTAVAKTLGIGGLSSKTGIDSSLAAFRNKLARLNVDYNEIVERMRLNK